MKYCSNCGEQIDEKAVICIKCGVPVNNNMNVAPSYTQTQSKQGHGAATASLVLGIIGLIVAIITIIIAACIFVANKSMNVYDYYSYSYSSLESSVKIVLCILLTTIPGLLSLIGLPLGCFCKKGGPKIAGIVLNTITILMCIGQVVLIIMA